MNSNKVMRAKWLSSAFQHNRLLLRGTAEAGFHLEILVVSMIDPEPSQSDGILGRATACQGVYFFGIFLIVQIFEPIVLDFRPQKSEFAQKIDDIARSLLHICAFDIGQQVQFRYYLGGERKLG